VPPWSLQPGLLELALAGVVDARTMRAQYLDHVEHPAGLLAHAYRWRWDCSETALREANPTIQRRRPRDRGDPARRPGSD
jgi:hypothetical protein